MMLRALAVAAAAFCFSGAAVAQDFTPFDAPLQCQTAPDVYSVNGGQRTQMRAIMVSTSTQARPYAGVRQYAVMPGDRAMTRLASDTSFLAAVPSNIQPQGVVVLASFEARRGNRLVLVGGGYMSWSTGIHPDRIIAVTMEPAGGSAPSGHTMYRVTPNTPLAAGEYALVIATGQQQGYAGIPGTFFDFGVD
jgi:hypothetical protein